MKLKTAVKWYLLLAKRLLKKPVFLLILLSIPVLTFVFTFFAKTEDTGFLHIVVSSMEETELSEKVIQRIVSGEGVIRYSVEKDPEKARKLVERGECDGAWILQEGLSDKVLNIADGRKETLVVAIEHEENTLSEIAKESIFASFYEEIAYCVYEQRVKEQLPDADEDRMREIYDENVIDGELISFEYAKSGKVELEDVNYLTSPLRGLLCAVMLMCALASSVYFLADERDGTYTRLSKDRRFFVLYGTNLAALTIAGVFASAALYFTGNYTDVLTETLMMVLYVIALCGFSSSLASVFSNVGTFCLILPVMTVVSLVLSPVFFDFVQLKALQTLLPAYHYLYGMAGASSVWYMLLYAVLSSAFGYVLYSLTVRVRYRAIRKIR